MGAQVQAKLDLETAGFRMKLSQVDSAWGRFEKKAVDGGKSLAAAFAPAATALAAVGAAAVAAGGVGAAVLGNWVSQGISLNSELENAQNAFAAFTGDAKKAGDIVKALKAEGDLSPLFSTGDMINAGKALMSSAKGSQAELMKLVETAELLAALNPEQGLGGAAFSMREAISGDYQSLIERFNISRSMVKDLKAQGKEGMQLVQEALRAMGVSTELIDNQATSWTGLQSQASSFFDNMKMELAQPVFEEFKAGLQSFADEISGGTGQDLLAWSKDIGESLGRSAHEVIESLKSINWPEILSQAAEFAKLLGEAAEAGATAALFGSSVIETSRNGLDKFASFDAKFTGNIYKGASKGFEFVGADYLANMTKKDAERAFGDAKRFDDNVANRKLQKDRAFQAKLAAANAPVTWDDTDKIAARTAGQLSPEQQARRAQYAKFQQGVRQQGQAVAKAGQVNVTLNERNPMHTVMAT